MSIKAKLKKSLRQALTNIECLHRIIIPKTCFRNHHPEFKIDRTIIPRIKLLI